MYGQREASQGFVGFIGVDGAMVYLRQATDGSDAGVQYGERGCVYAGRQGALLEDCIAVRDVMSRRLPQTDRQPDGYIVWFGEYTTWCECVIIDSDHPSWDQ